VVLLRGAGGWGSLVQNGQKRWSFSCKVLSGDSPYVKAKQVQVNKVSIFIVFFFWVMLFLVYLFWFLIFFLWWVFEGFRNMKYEKKTWIFSFGVIFIRLFVS
jgi:hypothetical protein